MRKKITEFPNQAKLMRVIIAEMGATKTSVALHFGYSMMFISHITRGISGIPVPLIKSICEKWNKDLELFIRAKIQDAEHNIRLEFHGSNNETISSTKNEGASSSEVHEIS